MAPYLLGLLTVALIWMLETLLPEPSGTVVLWSCLTVALGTAAVVTWRRTRLPFASLAMAWAATASAALAAAGVAGVSWRTLVSENPIFTICAVLMCPTMFFIQARRDREAWRRWRERVESSSLRDMLLLRHIPNLRNPGT